MLTRLRIENLKRFEAADIELGRRVVFVGPNNCGKTTALQALALWQIATQRWLRRYPSGEPPPQRPGVVIGRADLVSTPVPTTMQLWRGGRVGNYVRPGGRRGLDRIHIEVLVEGETDGQTWTCGMELDYANPESVNCRPRRRDDAEDGNRWSSVPPLLAEHRLAFLPPMSGLGDREFRKDPGEIAFLIGQGRTAEVLRNLCLQASQDDAGWERLVSQLARLFGADLLKPTVGPRADIRLEYEERGTRLDISCAGRGMQQTLLLLAYMSINPGAVLLLDEPDAHLEVLRQAQIYRLLCDEAERLGAQLIAATHSEKLLNVAAGQDVVVAFTGAPHRVDSRVSPVMKALQTYGFEHFLQAEERGWVLYVEGETDLAFLQAFAEKLDHPAREALSAPFVQVVANQPRKAEEHFHTLRDAFPELRGFALFDRLERAPPGGHPSLRVLTWTRREIENYLPGPIVLGRWAEARASEAEPLFRSHWPATMATVLADLAAARQVLGGDFWSHDEKVSEASIPRVFQLFHERVGAEDQTRKGDYHELVRLMRPDEIDPEVRAVLDAVHEVATTARPRT